MRDGGYDHIYSFFEFADRFRTEEDCGRYLFSRRRPNGFACPRCGASSTTTSPGETSTSVPTAATRLP